MKHKVGDRVRIQLKEWMDTQEKDDNGSILGPDGYGYDMSKSMQEQAGKVAVIRKAEENRYKIDIDGEFFSWKDWMFDPDYRGGDTPLSADKPLPAEDAIRAMLDGGETLYDGNGWKFFWDKDEKQFVWEKDGTVINHHYFSDLHRRPPKRKREMTRWEVLNWANSDASRGWVVRLTKDEPWVTPPYYRYEDNISEYQRARLLPDLSGVDESTIQGFEVEEV